MPPLPPLALTLLENKEKKKKQTLAKKTMSLQEELQELPLLAPPFSHSELFFFFLLSTEESACHHSEAQLLHSPIFLTIFIDVVLFYFQSVSYWSAEKKKYFISSPPNPLELL